MGNKGSKQDGTTKEIDKKIRQDLATDSAVLKLLLLGAGGSGKSTFAKQLTLMFSDGYLSENSTKASFARSIHSNMIQGMQILLAEGQRLGFTVSPDLESAAEKIKEMDYLIHDDSGKLSPQDFQDLKSLWQDPSVQSTLGARAQDGFWVDDNIFYFYDAIDRIADPEFIPTLEDVLQVRIRTTGIVETNLVVEGATMKLIDVGGQRCERRKWQSMFDNVGVVIFIASLSEYNEKLFEDSNINAMDEALDLFRSTINNEWFRDKPVILLLNKMDLFAEKLSSFPLSDKFPDYDGGSDVTAAIEFMKRKFSDLNESSNRDIYAHPMTAVDNTVVTKVWKSCKTIIFRANMADSGMHLG